MGFSEDLVSYFAQFQSSPFLFIGSGLSRRYLGLDDWGGLLGGFCNQIQPYEYYCASAENDLTRVASLMAEDFHEIWWKGEEFTLQREKYKGKIKTKSAALKYAICEYVVSKSQKSCSEGEYCDEINALRQINVDGIITTNWDTLLESLFQDYRVFIGQEQLLLASPQNIGEIYKIHGCVTDPSSLVLTHEDYAYFSDRNSYLAAKLITIFIEHPIVFFGYSLSDPNIIKLLKSITHCLGKHRQDQIGNHLIFVQRAKSGMNDHISKTMMTIEDANLPITLITCDSFTPIYNALARLKKKIPARVLRHCKEQLYQLVLSSTPEEKLAVVDLDKVGEEEGVEFVVGVGVIDQHMSTIGYSSITTEDLFEDLVLDNKDFNYSSIVEHTLPALAKRQNLHLPIFKFLRRVGINSLEDCNKFNINLSHLFDRQKVDFQTEAYLGQYLRSANGMNAVDIIDKFGNSYHTLVFIPFLEDKSIDVDVVESFLKANYHHFMIEAHSYKSFFKKLACYYDFIKYGWLV